MKNILTHVIKLFLPVLLRLTGKVNDPERVCIITFKLLGDAVFSIPAVRVIVENSLGKKISVFCYEDTKPIYEVALSGIEYITFTRNELNLNSRIPAFHLIKLIRKFNPYLLFDLTSEYQTAAASLFSGAKQKVGFGTKYFENFFTVFSLKRQSPDLTDMHLDPVLKYFNLDVVENRKIIKKDFTAEDKILIHPFAGWKAKEWGLDNFLRLARELNEVYHVEFIVQEGKLPDAVKSEIIGSGINILENKNVQQLIDELRQCSLLISNDSGPVYIAALLGKATFTLYGPTNPLYSLPRGNHHSFVTESLDCSPEIDKQYCDKYGGRLCRTFECMDRLAYENVKNNLETFIKRLNFDRVKAVSFEI